MGRSRRRGRWSRRSKKGRGRAGCVCRRRWVVGVVITEGEPRSGGNEPPCFRTGRAASVKRCAPHSLSVRGVFAARKTSEKTPSKNRMHVGNVYLFEQAHETPTPKSKNTKCEKQKERRGVRHIGVEGVQKKRAGYARRKEAVTRSTSRGRRSPKGRKKQGEQDKRGIGLSLASFFSFLSDMHMQTDFVFNTTSEPLVCSLPFPNMQ